MGDESALSLVAGASFLEAFAAIIPGPDLVSHCSNALGSAAFAGALDDDDYMLWIAEHRETGAPIGYQMLSRPELPQDTDDRDIELKRIYVLDRWHGSGLAREFVMLAGQAARARRMRRMLLGVYGGNDRAIAFYRKCGFATIGDRRFTVGKATFEDLVMALSL